MRHQLSGTASSVGGIASLLLLPKCPLCVAAWLSAAGLGAGSVSLLAPLLRPLAAALTVAAVLLLAWSQRHRVRAKKTQPACLACLRTPGGHDVSAHSIVESAGTETCTQRVDRGDRGFIQASAVARFDLAAQRRALAQTDRDVLRIGRPRHFLDRFELDAPKASAFEILKQ